jgi:cell pole-organizing protein PopZ
MEEILASIRRIIADDEPASAGPAPAPPAPATPPAPPRAAVVAPPSPPKPAPVALAPWTAPPPGPPAAVEPEQLALGAPVLAAEPPSDVFDLTEAMMAPALAGGFRTIDGESDLEFEDMSDDQPPARTPVDTRPSQPPAAERSLVSAATSAAVDSAFNSLAHTVLVQNARTLEDLVREMLRPMLKSWLDDNLPGLVERLVRAEIERVSRGRG